MISTYSLGRTNSEHTHYPFLPPCKQRWGGETQPTGCAFLVHFLFFPHFIVCFYYTPKILQSVVGNLLALNCVTLIFATYTSPGVSLWLFPPKPKIAPMVSMVFVTKLMRNTFGNIAYIFFKKDILLVKKIQDVPTSCFTLTLCEQKMDVTLFWN